MVEERTAKPRLVAGTREIAVAEIEDRRRFASLLGAEIPREWPPEALGDALPFFLELYQSHPEWVGSLGWYAVLTDVDRPVLCGSVGFKGAPDASGMVEIGYSGLPGYRGRGVASEKVQGLVGWALRHADVRAVEAETTADNLASIHVLERNGFRVEGKGSALGSVRYRLR